MKRGTALLALGLALGALAPAARGQETPAGAMFERMATLQGDWKGTYQWSGARTASGPLRATYYLSGNGSALIEDLAMGEGDKPSMTSVYHVDGSELRMTHFCAAKNQPRLKATKVDAEKGIAEFSFVDATNIGPSNPGHVNACEVRILGPDQIHIKFVFEGGKAQAVEDITLQRAKSQS